jgi:DNA-binding GntR family transcriptional regulator
MHRPVLEALAEGNAEKAGLLLRNHVEYFGELIMKGDAP